MMTTHQYTQDASQRERARVLKQDIEALRLAVSPEAGGRDPTSMYPRLPASSPWAQPGPGLEPPIPPAKPRGAR